MFLRRITIKKDGKAHAYWALMESVRTARGPRQRTVAYLGELGAAEQAGWAEVRRLLDRQPVPEASLFATPAAADEPIPEHITVHVRGVRVERTRDFGEVYLGLLLWRALHLDALLEAAILPGREDVPWAVVGAILALARFCEPGSELHIAESWYRRTGLPELLGVPVAGVNKDRLYRGLDAVRPHKATIERHLRERFATLFDATYDLSLYDVTSTYFEGLAAQNP